FYEKENRLLAEVHWAFPNTKHRDFHHIAEMVNNDLGGAILGRVCLQPESRCLRAEFAKPLNSLATAASAAVDEVTTKEQKNRETGEAMERIRQAHDSYTKRSALTRAFLFVTGQRPIAPEESGLSYCDVPSLLDWHDVFSRLECDPALSDFLVFDAGGYTLDVYGTFAGGEVVSQSFDDAGSTRLNEKLIYEERKLNPDLSSEEYEGKAERQKLQICGNPDSNEGHPFYHPLKTATHDIYAKHIKDILTQAKNQSEGKGFPIILTGGGGNNLFLRDLIKNRLARLKLKTVPINSPMLYKNLRQTGIASTTDLKLFLDMASGFNIEAEEPYLAPSTDVLGGLVQLVFEQ
ncbi:MAG: hypothetical protein D4R65_06035, partial [Verrucomicrobiaceae bacterium]